MDTNVAREIHYEDLALAIEPDGVETFRVHHFIGHGSFNAETGAGALLFEVAHSRLRS